MKIVTYAGRTNEAVMNIFDSIITNANNPYFQQLLANQANMPAKDLPFRGYMILDRDKIPVPKEVKRNPELPPLRDVQKILITEPKQIYFIYSGEYLNIFNIQPNFLEINLSILYEENVLNSGMGSQWPGMARQLISIPAFDESLRISSAAVKDFGYDVYSMLQKDDAELYKNNTLNCMLAITAIQVDKFIELLWNCFIFMNFITRKVKLCTEQKIYKCRS